MPVFTIDGKKITARNTQEAIRIFSAELTITEEKNGYPEPLDALDLPEWVKDGIVLEKDEDKLKKPFCTILVTDDSEVTVHGFNTQKQLDEFVIEYFEEPDGSSWSMGYVIFDGNVHTVKPTVTVKYIPYTKKN